MYWWPAATTASSSGASSRRNRFCATISTRQISALALGTDDVFHAVIGRTEEPAFPPAAGLSRGSLRSKLAFQVVGLPLLRLRGECRIVLLREMGQGSVVSENPPE